MNIDFTNLFGHAMGREIVPYPYQSHLANASWPDIVKIQTGMGKTAGIILPWLFKRLKNDPETPRRLVYCLPMRVLVEQTASNARAWIKNLVDSNIIPLNRQPSVYILMGGEIDTDWDRYPDQDVILIGTQDQLLSRVLNRGYATSRFRWPVQFGLLNNDCLWVLDEIQLMGCGLATTTQLDAFRKTFGTASPVRSIWMSATLQRDWLKTIDFTEQSELLTEIELSEKDRKNPSLKKRFEAKKKLKKADCPADKPTKIAETIIDAHTAGTRTLVVVNTVRRAIEIYKAVKKKETNAALTLIHSRFRPNDRQKAMEKILAPPDRMGSICISTQVVEAGVDISARTLITDLAPWASMVQRFGRCNRGGEDKKAVVIWLDIDLSKKGAALPYTEEDLEQSASILSNLKDVGSWNLPPVSSEIDHMHVLRRKDMIDLFDTTPDLAGADIDISRFIRETDDHDVSVFWRDLPKEGPDNEPAPSRNELCSVPVKDLKVVESLPKWRWDHLEKQWTSPPSISPGMVLMLPISSGCYSSEIGWTGNKDNIPELVDTGQNEEEANDDDWGASIVWQSLTDHTQAVVKEMKELLAHCNLSEEEWEETLLMAARWHDAGKTHEVFQKAMIGDPPERDNSIIWAKTGRGKVYYERKGFRHELASALAIMESDLPDLVAYLVASHHGKVRLSIRSLPNETKPSDPTTRFARGIWEGDTLPEFDLGGGQRLPKTSLNLSYMEFGESALGASWLARMLSLRDNPSLGPFRLAYLEALLRVADWRASQKAGEKNE